MTKIYTIILIFLSFNLFAWIDRDRMDPDHLIPQKILDKAYAYLKENSSKIKNQNFLSIIDFKQHNSKERWYLLDLNTGDVEKFLVAHGKNSDKDFDGYANSFSNTLNSDQSSLGFYLTAETYQGSHGLSLRLDGLSTTNSNARDRSIVIHGADYVAQGPKIGRSLGCPAVEMRYHSYLIDKIKNGSLIFAAFE